MRSLAKRLGLVIPSRVKQGLRKLGNNIFGFEKKYRGLDTKEVFNKIYAESAWGRDEQGEAISGSGSHDPRFVTPYIDAVRNLGAKLNWLSAVDLGCGDFNVGRHLLSQFPSYTACDISSTILARNRTKYCSENLQFKELNIAGDDLPPGDVAFVRQVLQHLGNPEIQAFTCKINRMRPYRYLLVTEHLPAASKFPPNLDKPSGPGIRISIGSGVVLDAPPFNLRYKKKQVVLEVREGQDAIIQSTLYEI